MTSLIDISTNYLNISQKNFDSVFKILKLFRVARMLKLIKSVQGIQRLVQTIIFSFPSLMNATSLLFLAYFIFSIMASKLFGEISYVYTENGQ